MGVLLPAGSGTTNDHDGHGHGRILFRERGEHNHVAFINQGENTGLVPRDDKPILLSVSMRQFVNLCSSLPYLL